LRDGQSILSVSCGGGGYGRPEERDPERVAKDVAEQWIDAQRALDVYRVAVRSDGAVDAQATAALRAS
jgi:N-methylhydantoinase B